MRDLDERTGNSENAFSCFLDQQPTYLVPRSQIPHSTPKSSTTELIVNPSFYYQTDNDLPIELLNRISSCRAFLRDYPIAWVEDPGTKVMHPYWTRGEWSNVMKSFYPGRRAPSALDPAMLHTLATANILVPLDYEDSRREEWVRISNEAQGQFQRQGYVIVKNLLHVFQLGAIRDYSRALVASGRLPLGDGQVTLRYHRHREVLATFFHTQLTHLVSRIAGEPVKPSYVYFASYKPGAELAKHVDREQCEFSISLLVDFSPDPDGPSGWPLYLERPADVGNVRAADLGIGDALFYRGRELVHYRPPLPEGHTSTSFFLHYVRRDFTGRLW